MADPGNTDDTVPRPDAPEPIGNFGGKTGDALWRVVHAVRCLGLLNSCISWPICADAVKLVAG